MIKLIVINFTRVNLGPPLSPAVESTNASREVAKTRCSFRFKRKKKKKKNRLEENSKPAGGSIKQTMNYVLKKLNRMMKKKQLTSALASRYLFQNVMTIDFGRDACNWR